MPANVEIKARARDWAGLLGTAEALGVACTVRRRVYIVDNTRIHLDEVEGLGQFVEVEVMLQEGEAQAAGHARLDQWMARLGIDQRDLLDAAYVDLILKCGDPA